MSTVNLGSIKSPLRNVTNKEYKSESALIMGKSVDVGLLYNFDVNKTYLFYVRSFGGVATIEGQSVSYKPSTYTFGRVGTLAQPFSSYYPNSSSNCSSVVFLYSPGITGMSYDLVISRESDVYINLIISVFEL